MRKPYPSQEYIKSILKYDAKSGLFTWKPRVNYSQTWNKRYANKPAGSLKVDSGYVLICIDYSLYRAHRLAIIYQYGDCECQEVDHINGNRSDNRISNLRVATRNQNRRNTKIPNNNSTKIMGVSWDKSRGRWQTYINPSDRNRISLGRYDDFFEACCVRRSAEVKYNYHENHGKR